MGLDHTGIRTRLRLALLVHRYQLGLVSHAIGIQVEGELVPLGGIAELSLVAIDVPKERMAVQVIRVQPERLDTTVFRVYPTSAHTEEICLGKECRDPLRAGYGGRDLRAAGAAKVASCWHGRP